MKRREFIGLIGNTSLLMLAGPSALIAASTATTEFLFLEAESFANYGGWDLDQQSMDVMGSPYLLAHGLGVPVVDAVTEVEFPVAGSYRLWVRTKDWVAPWKAPGAPGKFQVMIDGAPVKETFGTKGDQWHWHDGGIVKVNKNARIALHDLTGFEGRCEAILFCKDPHFKPVNDVAALTKFRRKLNGLSDVPVDGGKYDLAVIGGGIAGTAAAISAARQGLKVVLVQDRPVLGGNGSSEVRVWPEGHTKQEPFVHVGEIVEEFVPLTAQPVHGTRNALGGMAYNDELKLQKVKAEPNITLLLHERAFAVEAVNNNIKAVVLQNIKTGIRKRITATYFADCTGDAGIGFMAGADFEQSQTGLMGVSNLWNVLDAADDTAVLECECKDKTALATQCEIGQVAQPFPRCPWAIDLTDKPFPGRKNFKGQWGKEDPLANLGGWFWESGFDKDPVTQIELIRDLNLRAMYGAWDALKNVDKEYPNHRLGWAAFIAGKRESRRLMGDVILSADDFRNHTPFPDPAFPCSWHIDIHRPDPAFDKDLKGQEFISRATEGDHFTYKQEGSQKQLYWAPYRVLYSRNISNLFMAGRNISVNNDGLGPIRVMRTCGMMGEVVGKAASLCVKYNTTPRGVYEQHAGKLRELMKLEGSYRV
ncbi:FAD-dependent oxidoreductase [Chitinophaga sp. sic0106]|uniref:FAD-dependent oxidoreductase n=1 Tax=Chitinophaga sp. sic0106 TaxID=2854785 RepID=UPI001C44157C|nr:FAD-dependent oxidoreductase [Chitinophaga sp. sic0106]MBV7532903.1 FAD-dependent oxidoreductase [Chitinophaga sp. sic0106]